MRDYYVEEDSRHLDQDGFDAFPQVCDATGWRVSPHSHSAVEVLYITRGAFRVYSDDTEYIAKAGSVVLFRSSAVHWITPVVKNGFYYVLKVKPSFILEFSSKAHGPEYLLKLALHNDRFKTLWTKEDCQQTLLPGAFQRLMAEADNASYGSDIGMKIAAAEIILSLLRATEDQETAVSEVGNEQLLRRIYDAIVYINKHYAEDITAEKCSEHVFLSYSYFSRNFKRITGRTFKDYLIITRLNHAEKELISTEKSITEISADCGFNSVSYFISVYRKLKGVTPSSFRSESKK